MSQIYSKSSFDRFGDDLSEVILSYLSLEDKIRLECVSRQFARTVFERQYDLIVHFEQNIFSRLKGPAVLEKRFIDLTAFESVLRKCPSIAYIDIRYCKFFEDFDSFERMLSLIITHCRHLTAIEYDFSQNSPQTIEHFFRTFGPQLKTIELFDNQLIGSQNRPVLEYCPAIKEIKLFNLSHIFSDNNSKVLAKNLQRIEANYCNEDSTLLPMFMDNNRNSLVSIDIRVGADCQRDAIQVLMRQLSSASHLSDLKLNVSFDVIIGDYFAESLQQIGLKCLKLKSLELRVMSESNAINAEIFRSMKHFRQIKRLQLNVECKKRTAVEEMFSFDVNFKSKALRECQSLTHLTLTGCPIDDKFFKYVDIHLKRLQCLHVTEASVSDITISLLSELPDLQTLVFTGNQSRKGINESVVHYLIRKCPKLKTFKCDQRRGQKAIALDDSKIALLRQKLEFLTI